MTRRCSAANGSPWPMFVFAALAPWCSAAAPASAHPFHATTAEVEWNAETGCLEVALRVAPEDLEAALRSFTGRRIVLEREDESALDDVLTRYVSGSFEVKPRLGRRRASPAKLQWVGHELTSRHVWLYFEIPLPEGTTALDLTQTMFTEQLPRQVNTVTLRVGRWTGSVHCTAARPTQSLALPAPVRRPK